METDNRKVMVRLDHVGKTYRLGQIGSGTFREDLQSWWYRLRGKDDPNLKIGQRAFMPGTTFEALKDVSLTVRQGECLGIIGGNGAGKSTMLKLISRVTAPTQGSIDLYGRVTSMLEVGTGFHREMTGRENIYLNGAILGMTSREIDAVIDRIIDFSEVREFIDTPVKRYSSGMYVKLGFAVAAHLESEIVIMDEVLAVGDLAFQKKCIDRMLSAAHDENKTVLFVSHNMNMIRELCDRCVVLDQGRIIFDGDVDEAIRRYSSHLMSARGMDAKSLDDRRDWKTTGKCRAEALFADSGVLKSGDPFVCCASVSAEEPMTGVRLRIIVSNEEGTIVGMTYSDPFDLDEGKNVVEFAVPTEPLAAGGYVCDIALFDYGGSVENKHDFVRKALAFRIDSADRPFGRKWTARSWGNVHLAPIRIDAVRPGEEGSPG